MQLEFNFDDTTISERIHERAKTAKIPIPGGFVEPRNKPKSKSIDNIKIIDRLRKGANSLMKQADNISTEVSGNWTHRRQRFADNARKKKEVLIKDATILNKLADLWELNQCPKILQKVRTRSDLTVYYPNPLDGTEVEWVVERNEKNLKKCNKLGLTCKEDWKGFDEAIYQLSIVKLSPEEEKKIELEKAIAKIRPMKIAGFFPTPDNLIDFMIDQADLDKNHSILEPSAGIGSICDRLRERGFNGIINACEIVPSLYEILRLKGYVCSNEDILSYKQVNGELWDRILMNPPFEKKQDIDHVLHCYNTFLKDGGRLVSIMSAGVQYNSDKKTVAFREFIESKNGLFIENGKAFKGSFNNTAVNTVTLIIDK